MRRIVTIILLVIVALGITCALVEIPFGEPKTKVGGYYIRNGSEEMGASNIVGSVVVNYRGLDTLGEVTVLFTGTIGLGAIFATWRKEVKRKIESASLVLYTGCRFLFPLILMFGVYIIMHGHLTPGGGFQGGAIIASAFLLLYLGCPESRISEITSKLAESTGGLTFLIIGLVGLAVSGHFLTNFLPKGTLFSLLSAGVIPIVYIAVGVKVGSELAEIIHSLMVGSE